MSVDRDEKLEIAVRAFVLTPRMVAQELGLTERRVRTLCAKKLIMPTFLYMGRRLIRPGYVVFDGRPPGRPKGRKGKYPKGVKRPRKDPLAAVHQSVAAK